MVKSPSDVFSSATADKLIAVTGVGCRFPGGTRFPGGARDFRSLGELFRDGTTVIREVPQNRWGPEFHDPGGGRRGTTVSHVGAFLDDIDRFDAAFFGISPREAGSIDPQQRTLLEVAWEAMADAGYPREDWAGSRTAVFTGMLAGDYATLHTKTLGAKGISPHYATGIEPSFAAGRIAYAFDLHGPTATISSACSSSLLAVHLAAQSLRCGECDAAIAGGVSLLIVPELSIFMSSIGALSPSGTCRPFDRAADGVLRGEGCGVVVLRRLSDALADGDRVYAVLLGSAVNHDGFSLSLTAPNAAAQESLLRSALTSAGVEPDDVDYAEAHGTGTPLGDEIELRTLAEVYGSRRDTSRPLFVGSHKAILGHCDAAAGIAGMLKAIWVSRERFVPAQPLQREAKREGTGVEVPVAGVSLAGLDRPVRTAVSAFGLSGTNVHLVLSAPVPRADLAVPAPRPSRPVRALLLSASRPEGLAEQAARMAPLVTEAIGGSSLDELDDLLASAAVRRTQEACRRVILVEDAKDLADALADPAAGCTGFVDSDEIPEPVFVYSGQGCQWPGMAADLYEADATIRSALDECDALIREHASWSLVDELRKHQGSRLGDTDVAQPAIFAVQVAISRWLAEHGVRPAAMIGHSLGEVTAAHIAGCLSLQDAVRLVVLRGRLLHETAGTGRMTTVAADEDTVRAVLDDLHSEAVIAAVNGPRSVVLAGRTDDLSAATRELAGRGLRCVPLPVNYAFHSPVVAMCGPRLRTLLAGLEPAVPALRLLSSAAPAADLERPDAAYWEKNLTDPVLLWPAIDRMLAGMTPALIEIGPHPILAGPLTDAIGEHRAGGVVLSTMRRGRSGPLALHKTLASLHVAGVGVDWERVTGRPRRYRTLPVPFWADERYWLPGLRPGQQSAAPGTPSEPAVTAEPAPSAAKEPADGNPPRAGRGQDTADAGHRVADAVRKVLGLHSDQRVPRGRGLFELGLDSLGAVELRRSLEAEFGIVLESTVVFEHPTVEALSARVVSVAAQAREPGEKMASDASPGSAVAVIGIACRLPGAGNPEEFWSLLTEGGDAIGPLPLERRRDPAWTEIDASVPTDGGYLDDMAGFDAPFFHVSPREARSLDPQQRLFMEIAWEALEDAGVPAQVSKETSTGVYLGLNTADYQQLLTRDMSSVDLYYGTGTSFAAAAGRLSYFLGLRGPSMAIDTACSASLTAVHLACQGLREGDCELAIAGGANVILAPTVAASMSSGGALAPDGRCKTFDEAANGYGRGEGAVAIVLKPLQAARRDHDHIYAIIAGSAVNSDGASGGLTVPSAAAQTAVIRRALTRASWAPGDVDYVEAHGTGTPLGDPIEIRALAEAMGPGRTAPLLTGSVKPNIGHLEAAAGAAGLLKVILSLYHGELPPHRLDRPSSRIDWKNLPIEVVTRRRAWPAAGRPARAGVSAFGFSGSNAHVLVEQEQVSRPAESPAASADALPPLIVTAATATALHASASRMAIRVRSALPNELAALVHTALHRRTWLDHRLAVDVAKASPAEIADALDAGAAGAAHPRVRSAVVGDETPDPFAAERAAEPSGGYPPVSLPAYPWEHGRYWYRDEPEQFAAPADERFFRVNWTPVKTPENAPAEPATWVVIGTSALAAGLAEELTRFGHVAVCVPPPRRADRGGTWREKLTELAAGQPQCHGVVFVPEPDAGSGSVGLRDVLLDAVTLGQGIAAVPRAPGRLWFVTSGAQDPEGGTNVDPVHTAVWETGRVLAMEMPARWGGMIDVGPDADAAGWIAQALQADGLDDQMCVRGGTWYAARLVRQGLMDRQRVGVAVDRWHVVLGDQNAAPAVSALVAAGARQLLLVGDVPEPPAHVTWLRCSPEDLERHAATVGPLGDVVAVWTPPATKGLSCLTEHDVAAGLDAPVLLTETLTAISKFQPQRMTVVTSAAPSWGSVNTAGWAGATGWLTGWARRVGRPADLLALMPRGDTGELTDEHWTLFEQSGLRLLTADDAADLIQQALRAGRGERSAAVVHLPQYVRLCQELAPRAFLSSLTASEPMLQVAAVRDRLLALPAAARSDAMLEHVIAVVAETLGMQVPELDPDRGFFDLGMDSVMTLAMRTRLENDLGLELPSTLAFEYSTAQLLASYLLGEVAAEHGATDLLAAEMAAAERALALTEDAAGE